MKLIYILAALALSACAHECPQPICETVATPPTEQSCKETCDRHASKVIDQLFQCNKNLESLKATKATKVKPLRL